MSSIPNDQDYITRAVIYRFRIIRAPTKISVVTAAFNRTATVAKTIQSVQKQTHGQVEHVILDGGPNDGCTFTIVENREDYRAIRSNGVGGFSTMALKTSQR